MLTVSLCFRASGVETFDYFLLNLIWILCHCRQLQCHPFSFPTINNNNMAGRQTEKSEGYKFCINLTVRKKKKPQRVYRKSRKVLF